MTDRVVIVGGGAIGSSIAYWLTREPWPGEVVVIERDPTYARASSALSASAIRQQFSTPVNIAIGQHGFAFLRRAGELLAVDGERAEIGLVEQGYLFLASPAGVSTLEANHRVQREHGADVELLSPAALADRFPWLSIDGLGAASLGRSGEGWFDGYGLLRAFRRKAIAQGARYIAAEVVGAERSGRRVEGLRLADGQRVACDIAVNAAGPWARPVAAMLGVDLPVRARARSVFVLQSRAVLPGCPLVIDPSSLWVRTEGRHLIAGAPPRPGDDRDDLPLEPDHTLFEEVIWPALAARIPAFEELRVVNAWVGYYEMNTVSSRE